MNARHIAFAAALAASIALLPEMPRADEGAAARKRVAPKEALVRRLVEDSPAIERIRASGNAEAAGYMDQASARYAAALHALADDDYAQAEARLNDAMWLVGRARQLVPDPMSRAIEWRVRNAGLRQSVQALRASYAAQLRQGAGRAGDAIADATLSRVDARLDEAQGYSVSEQLPEAHASLRAAEAELLRAFADTLGNRTLRYSVQFANPADEYTHELARHASYRELVPVAREQLRPGPAASAAMDRHVAAASARLKRAEAAASMQDYRGALVSVRAATSQLESALAEAGLDVPRAALP
jgi:hypothetical protein